MAALIPLAAGCSSADDDGSAVNAPGLEPPASVSVQVPSSEPLTGDLLRPTRVADLGEMATDLVARPGSSQLFVTTRSGLVYRIDRRTSDDGTTPVLVTRPVLDQRARTSTDGERGLLGAEFSSDGDTLVLVSTDLEGAVTIEAHDVDDAGEVSGEGRVVGAVPHPLSGHNGGGILRLPDGDLLVSLGDMDTGDQPTPAAQDPESVLGSVVRLPAAALDGGLDREWPTPADVVAKGLRNPWRIALDDDDVLIGDVGDVTAEEIDALAIDPGGAPANLGWPWYEGTTQVRTPRTPGPFSDPVIEYPHGDGRCGIVLGAVPTGPVVDLDGAVLFGDLCSTSVFARRRGDGADVEVARLSGTPIAFGVDQDDQVYVLSADGRIDRLDPARWIVPDTDAAARPPDTTTTLPAAPRSLCAVFTSLVLLSDPSAVEAGELELGIDGILTGLSSARSDASGSDRDDVDQLLAAFEAVRRAGAASGWDVDDPAFTTVLSEIVNGTPPYEEFGSALSRLQDRVDCG